MKESTKLAAIAVDKSLLKEYETSYGRTVYLDKDSEFQIKLFNPYNYTIGAEILINGKSLGDDLIIRPGQLVWLERYFNEARKFRFDVYEVDGDKDAVRKAIRDNGTIVVKFHKEKEPAIQTIYSYDYSSNPYKIINGDTTITPTVNWDTLVWHGGASELTSINASCSSFSLPSIETGRVEKGGHSNQGFVSIDLDLELWAFHTEEIKLLPKSQKPVYKEDLNKVYCTNCGRKIKSKFRYCPFCGHKCE